MGSIANTWRMSEAAAVVQKLLEFHGSGTNTEKNAAKIANQLVQRVYDARPELVKGRMGTRPHKASLAAAALGVGIEKLSPSHHQRPHVLDALQDLLTGIAENPHQFAFSLVDHALIEAASQVLIDSNADPLLNELMELRRDF